MGCLVDVVELIASLRSACKDAPTALISEGGSQHIAKHRRLKVAVLVKVQAAEPKATHRICVVGSKQPYLRAVNQRDSHLLLVGLLDERFGEVFEVVPCNAPCLILVRGDIAKQAVRPRVHEGCADDVVNSRYGLACAAVGY